MMTSSLLSVALFASALTQEVHAIEPGLPVHVHGSAAQLVIVAGPIGSVSVRVEAHLDRALDRVVVTDHADGLVIRLQPLARGQQVRGRVVLEVPKTSPVWVVSPDGDVDISGPLASVRVDTMSGDVRIRSPADDVQVRTLTGNIEIEGSEATSLVLDSVSGDIRVHGERTPGLPIEVHTLTGRIELSPMSRPAPSPAVSPS